MFVCVEHGCCVGVSFQVSWEYGYLPVPSRRLVCGRPVLPFFHHVASQFLTSCHASHFPGQICVFHFVVQVYVCWCWSAWDQILRVTGWFFSLVYYPHLLHSHTLVHTRYTHPQHTCTHTHTHARMHACTHTHTCAHAHAHTYTHTHYKHMHACARTHATHTLNTHLSDEIVRSKYAMHATVKVKMKEVNQNTKVWNVLYSD